MFTMLRPEEDEKLCEEWLSLAASGRKKASRMQCLL